MYMYPIEENRRLVLAIIFSLILHLLLFISTEMRLNFAWMQQKEKVTRSDDIIRFDLIRDKPPMIIETPKIDKEESPSEPTNIISDKDMAAKDMTDKEQTVNDLPYAEGKMKIEEVRKSVPAPLSIPQKKSEPQPDVRGSKETPSPPSKGEESGIEMVPEKKLPPEIVKKDAQKESIASLPQDTLRIPLYDNRLSHARGFGEISFNVKKHEVAPYILKMKKKIEKHWAPPVIFSYYGFTSGETVVQFKIMPDGKVEDITVLKEKGDESLKKASIQAIRDSSPFDPIPPNILEGEKEQFLGITFTFFYIIDKPVREPDDIS